MSARSGAVSGRPEQGEYAAYAAGDVDHVPGDDAIAALEGTAAETVRLFTSVGEEEATALTYASGKWTLKEVLGHLIDDERIFAYRALCIARGDSRELPGFDEKEYVAGARFESRSITQLLDEYRSVRAATIALFNPLTSDEWRRRGSVNGYVASVRGLAFHIAAHELHHLRTIRERYLGQPNRPATS